MVSIFLPGTLVGALSTVLILVALVAHFLALLPFALLKFALPLPAWRRFMTRVVIAIAQHWVSTNGALYRLLFPMSWEVEVHGKLDPRRSYVLLCNHQSMTDILVLFDVFHGRTPFLRFFLKHQLLYVPVIGLACWAMDFPFMKRHTREAVERNPALRAEDLETTRRACAKYREHAVTLVNFLDGTRFTEAKRIARQSPFRHLLRPKSAGLSFALNAMGDRFEGVIDVTLDYASSERGNLLWSFLCGEQTQLFVHVDVLPLPQELMHGDYQNDPDYRARFQAWVNQLWARKDARLDRLRRHGRPAVQPAAHP
jgi:1-acyl-sn-glycerol-3-phosphate acyltransferase